MGTNRIRIGLALVVLGSALLSAAACGEETLDPTTATATSTSTATATSTASATTASSSSSGDPGPSCFHHACTTGDYLDPECSPCVAAICDYDEACCLYHWDDICAGYTRRFPDVCACPGETECLGLRDEDFDVLFDCQDPDCAASCTPGGAALGGPCTVHADCDAAVPACIDEAHFPDFRGGYCSGFCALGSDECGASVLCVATYLGDVEVGLCRARCDVADPDACRAGYVCEDDGDGPFCRPIGEECRNGVDDDGDGATDCIDASCLAAFECFEVCDDGLDDNGDGRIDCEDASCSGFPACTEWTCGGFAPVPATSCIAVGGAVACHPITNAGCGAGEACDAHYGNYAFECVAGAHDAAVCTACDETHRCAPGSTCVATKPDLSDAQCARFCCADVDCGPGSRCNKAVVTALIGLASPVGACVVGTLP